MPPSGHEFTSPLNRPAKERGFVYIALLIFVAITSTALAASGMLFSDGARREKEADLLFIGNQYRQAITAYKKQENRYPATLDVLVEKKQLRRLYRDPISGSARWGLIEAPDAGGITGVYSLAEGQPFKTANFAERDKDFTGAGSYAEWRFVAQ